jgi:radical SAM superfamily enzyme YgiQ (UPF0313 family)
MRITFAIDEHEHLGVGYLASVARKAGHEVALVSIGIGDYLTGYRSSARHVERSARSILRSRPDIAAFSLTSPTAGVTSDIARLVGASGVPTIAGGPHASAEPRRSSEEGNFSALIRGEAEAALLPALEWLREGGPVPPWIDTLDTPARESVRPPELDELPHPAKDLFYAHLPHASRDYTIITSRGCPYRCTFCAGAHRAGKPGYRRRAPEAVIDELIWAKRRFSPRSVYILDDVFTLQNAWLERFLTLYTREVRLPFHALTHPKHVDPTTVRTLRRAGCYAMRMGVQTLTPRVRKRLQRPETNADVANAIEVLHASGIRIEVDHMLDLPEETEGDLRAALEFYERHRPDAIRVYWLTPLPGSSWFEEVAERGLVAPEPLEALRRGRGYGAHSYLFPTRSVSHGRWLGMHLMLAVLPLLPRRMAGLLRALRAHRWIVPPPFTLVVALSRLPLLLRRKDEVGAAHARRLAAAARRSHRHPLEFFRTLVQ